MNRKSRQAEIDAMIAEMMNTTPQVKVHPKIKGEEEPIAPTITTDGAVVVPMWGNGTSSDGPGNDSGADDDLSSSDSDSDTGQGAPELPMDESKNNSNIFSDASPSTSTAEEIMDRFALDRKIPISHQVELGGHDKAVTCLSVEPAGNRVVSGSLDYMLKFFDFGGMDSRHNAFRSVEPDDGHPIVSIAHSFSGDRFVIGTGSCQPKVYDRDGTEIIKFVRGDMYLRDLSNTKVGLRLVLFAGLLVIYVSVGAYHGGNMCMLASYGQKHYND